jgi:hypothetical protein
MFKLWLTTPTVLALIKYCSYCQFSEKLSEYTVWPTFSGLSGPDRASNRQTQDPSTTLKASQIKTRVII